MAEVLGRHLCHVRRLGQWYQIVAVQSPPGPYRPAQLYEHANLRIKQNDL
jgi:hypothetical protein